MGASNDEFFKYPKTIHLYGSKLADEDKMLSLEQTNIVLAQEHVDYVWESKLDGTNVGISFDENLEIKIQNRGHILTTGEHEQYNIFRSWAATYQDRLLDVLEDRYLMFGEWMYARHTIKYTKLPHYFMEFDIWDRTEKCEDGTYGKFLSTPRRRELLKDLVKDRILAQVPVVYPEKLLGYGDSGVLKLEEARKLMLSHGPLYGEDKPEGLYLKIEKKGFTVDRYKLVRDEFIQKIIDGDEHWKNRPIEKQGLADDFDIFSPAMSSGDEAADEAAGTTPAS